MIAAPATSTAAHVSRALHEDAHASVSDPSLDDADRLALVGWWLDYGREYGPDTDARETFAQALACWSASDLYRRDLLAFLCYPEPAVGETRDEVEARQAREDEERRARIRDRYRRSRGRADVEDQAEDVVADAHLAAVIPLRRRRSA